MNYLPKAAARGVNTCNHCQLRPATLSSGIARDATVLKRYATTTIPVNRTVENGGWNIIKHIGHYSLKFK